jgi:hypothetical protein
MSADVVIREKRSVQQPPFKDKMNSVSPLLFHFGRRTSLAKRFNGIPLFTAMQVCCLTEK